MGQAAVAGAPAADPGRRRAHRRRRPRPRARSDLGRRPGPVGGAGRRRRRCGGHRPACGRWPIRPTRRHWPSWPPRCSPMPTSRSPASWCPASASTSGPPRWWWTPTSAPWSRPTWPGWRTAWPGGFAGLFVVMRMGGGVLPAAMARAMPVQTLHSGPVGGVAAAAMVGHQLGHSHVITTDVGGTSFDVGLVIDGEVMFSSKPMIERQALAIPVVDVTSIGTGGGSIAWIDEALGALRVGPASAGAVPGPGLLRAGRHPADGDRRRRRARLVDRSAGSSAGRGGGDRRHGQAHRHPAGALHRGGGRRDRPGRLRGDARPHPADHGPAGP